MPFPRSNASVLLDLMRGVAALAVLGEHWRNLLFVDFPQLPRYKWLAALPYLVTSAGHQAVVVFFVLSGFLIGGTIFRAVDENRWSWASYLLHRLLRLWIVLLPGLLGCVFWDSLGLHLSRAPLLYGGAAYNHLVLAVRPNLSVRIFVWNALFQGGLRVPMLGSDGPLWSLSVEFWYYLLFPLAWLLYKGRTGWGRRLVVLLALAAVAFAARMQVLILFPIWLTGAWLARVPLPVLRPAVRWAIVSLYVPCFFLASKFRDVSGLVNDYGLGLLTAILMVAVLSARGRADEGRRGVRLTRFVARGSFTLYVVHLPFAVFLTSLVAHDTRGLPAGGYLVKSFGVLALTLLYAYAVAFVTEFRTDTVRGWLEHQLRLTPPPKPGLDRIPARS